MGHTGTGPHGSTNDRSTESLVDPMVMPSVQIKGKIVGNTVTPPIDNAFVAEGCEQFSTTTSESEKYKMHYAEGKITGRAEAIEDCTRIIMEQTYWSLKCRKEFARAIGKA